MASTQRQICLFVTSGEASAPLGGEFAVIVELGIEWNAKPQSASDYAPCPVVSILP